MVIFSRLLNWTFLTYMATWRMVCLVHYLIRLFRKEKELPVKTRRSIAENVLVDPHNLQLSSGFVAHFTCRDNLQEQLTLATFFNVSTLFNFITNNITALSRTGIFMSRTTILRKRAWLPDQS